MDDKSLEEAVVDNEVQAQWRLRIERLYTRVQMRLGELAEACALASADLSDGTLAAVDRAVELQGALWDDIIEAETILAQDVPAILDSAWRPFPPHLEAARVARSAPPAEAS